jgi:hypothetical protein
MITKKTMILTSLMALVCAAAIPHAALAKPADSDSCRKAGGKPDAIAQKNDDNGGTQQVRKAGGSGQPYLRKAGGDGIADIFGDLLNRDGKDSLAVDQKIPTAKIDDGVRAVPAATNGDGISELFGKFLDRNVDTGALAVNQIAPLTEDDNVRVIKDETSGDGKADLIVDENDGMDNDVLLDNDKPNLEIGKFRPINPTLQVADKLNGAPINLPQVITPASNPVPQVTPNVVPQIPTMSTRPVTITLGGAR